MDTPETNLACASKKYQKASTVCCSANVLLFLAHQYAILEEISPLRILREFSRVARRTWRKFLEFFSFHSNSLAHSHLPCLRINPIPHRRYQGAGKLHAVEEGRLRRLRENHRWVLLRGTFFLQVAVQCTFLEEISPLRILREFSQVARRTWRNFLEISSLRSKFLAYSPALPACESYSTQATSRR